MASYFTTRLVVVVVMMNSFKRVSGYFSLFQQGTDCAGTISGSGLSCFCNEDGNNLKTMEISIPEPWERIKYMLLGNPTNPLAPSMQQRTCSPRQKEDFNNLTDGPAWLSFCTIDPICAFGIPFPPQCPLAGRIDQAQH